ncbi:HlyD family secretion protein [Paracoccus homiensis]|uniref:HlyD family secretion protein n=1 Tax=Paracoccus homiensis TaxID=364199 RepID=UPI00398CAA2B
MNKTHLLPSAIALVIGIAGVALLLFTWHLPPFQPADPVTENAYIRGKVTTLAPQVSGYVSTVAATDFQDVQKGDVIARIDDRSYRQRLAQAKAQLAATQAALQVGQQNVASAKAALRANQAAVESARFALETAETDWNRARRLTDRGVAAQSTADQSELALNNARAAVTQAEAQVQVQREAVTSAQVSLAARRADIESAKAAVELAQIDLDNTVIRAPATGRLGQVSVREGQYVTAGTALVSHVGRDLWVVANFKETSLKGLRVGETAEFTVDALQHQRFTGKVQAFSPATASEFSLMSGSAATGNFTKIAQRLPVRISIDADQAGAQDLSPGMSVVVRVETVAQGT